LKVVLNDATRFRFSVGAAVLLAWSFTSGCSSDDAGTREYRDIGQVCLESSDAQRMTFRVFTGGQCLSACDENVMSCSATQDGNRIELHTVLEVTPIASEKGCIALCDGAEARCVLDVPSAGNYQFGFASLLDTEALPVEGSIPLFGDHPCEPTPSVPRLSQ
jgi:hypothetical protein